MILYQNQMMIQRRRRVGYRKERNRIIKKRILGWIRNPLLDLVWIKDLPRVYYSILDDELI